MSDTPFHLIFGGNGGIGLATARRLVERGDRVGLVCRDADAGNAAQEESGAERLWVAESASFDAVSEVVAEAVAEFGRLDGAINAVGSVLLKPAHLTSESDYHDVVRTNLDSAFAVVRAVGKHAAKFETSTVLFSTAASRVGLANHEAIAAAKGGVSALVRSAATTYSRQRLRFNCIAPGLVRTNATKRIVENDKARESSEAMHALGRVGEADEVASLAAWLVGPDGRWVTGQEFGVDGGLATTKGRS